MNDTAVAPPMPVPRQRFDAMKEVRSRDDVPAWVADVLSDTGKGKPKSPHLYDQGHDAWPFVGRMHWRVLVRYAHLPAESKAIAAWSMEQRLPHIRPSKGKIVDDSGVSDRAVNMAIDVLKWLGYVDVVGRPGDNNEYFLTFPLVDTTRLIRRPDPSITPLHGALKAVVEGRALSPDTERLLDLDVLTPPAEPDPAEAPVDRFAEAWAMFPPEKRGTERAARRAWQATVAADVDEFGVEADAVELALHRATRWMVAEAREAGTEWRFIPAARNFFAPDSAWRDYRPDGPKDPNRPVVYADGVPIR